MSHKGTVGYAGPGMINTQPGREARNRLDALDSGHEPAPLGKGNCVNEMMV